MEQGARGMEFRVQSSEFRVCGFGSTNKTRLHDRPASAGESQGTEVYRNGMNDFATLCYNAVIPPGSVEKQFIIMISH
jgi:hypothetical protein